METSIHPAAASRFSEARAREDVANSLGYSRSESDRGGRSEGNDNGGKAHIKKLGGDEKVGLRLCG
jgi:hypothetical protein